MKLCTIVNYNSLKECAPSLLPIPYWGQYIFFAIFSVLSLFSFYIGSSTATPVIFFIGGIVIMFTFKYSVRKSCSIQVERIYELYNTPEGNGCIIFDEEHAHFSSNVTKTDMNLNYDALKSLCIFKHYFVLKFHTDYPINFIIDRQDLSSQDMTDFLSFIHDKMPHVTIRGRKFI